MKIAYITDVGERSVNEDSMYIPPEGAKPLYIVSDGMGGHKAGITASRLAAASVVEYVEQSTNEKIGKMLQIAAAYANSRVFAAAKISKAYEDMGTTLVAVYVENDKFYTANIGDSRVYLYNGDELAQITDDHSYVGELVRAGEISEREARNHPRRNIITKAVGIKAQEAADIFKTDWKPGDIILICSDGLYDGALDEDIFKALKNMEDLNAVCRELVYLAREGGSGDNISIILIRNEEEEHDR